MNSIRIVKILRPGKKTCKNHIWRIGTMWRKGRCFIRICSCGEVQECAKVGTQKNKKIRFLSSEVATLLGISKKWLYLLESKGKIPRAKRDKNNFRFYTKSDVKRLKKNRARGK